MSRRAPQSIVANPVLVGAVTVLVVVIAVFLAYNANNGLPFVPTRQLDVTLSNGAALVPGNEVRSGGYRIGVVEEMVPQRLPDGTVGARVQLKLDRKAGAIPTDSTIAIRPVSALGLKYVEVTRGRAARTVPDGGALPRSQTSIPVELDDVYSMFDARTRRASAQNLVGFGDALAFRGQALNETIARAPQLFGLLQPVMRNLADPATDLPAFFRELGDTTRVLAPVAHTQARLFTTMADTFAAIDRDPQALRDTISKSPPAMDAAIESFRVQRPFLRDTVAFSRDLQAAAADLRPTLPTINRALERGTPIVRRSAQLSDELQGAMDALHGLASSPGTNAALRGLTATVATLQPQLRFLGPYVTVCNSWNYFWTLVAEHFTSPTAAGSAQRTMLNTAGQQSNSIGASGATRPAAGKNVVSGSPQFLHGNYYGRAIDDQGNADCEAGQQGYIHGANPFTTSKDPAYQRVVTDPQHALVDEGPTYAKLDREGHGVGLGPSRVPAGETYTSRPGGTSPQLAVP